MSNVDCNKKADCVKVREMISSVVDGEASNEELKTFNEHLSKCTSCKDYHEKERFLLAAIKEKMSSRCCPEDLLKKIKTKILSSSR